MYAYGDVPAHVAPSELTPEPPVTRVNSTNPFDGDGETERVMVPEADVVTDRNAVGSVALGDGERLDTREGVRSAELERDGETVPGTDVLGRNVAEPVVDLDRVVDTVREPDTDRVTKAVGSVAVGEGDRLDASDAVVATDGSGDEMGERECVVAAVALRSADEDCVTERLRVSVTVVEVVLVTDTVALRDMVSETEPVEHLDTERVIETVTELVGVFVTKAVGSVADGDGERLRTTDGDLSEDDDLDVETVPVGDNVLRSDAEFVRVTVAHAEGLREIDGEPDDVRVDTLNDGRSDGRVEPEDDLDVETVAVPHLEIVGEAVIERVTELHAELEGESVERIVGSVPVGEPEDDRDVETVAVPHLEIVGEAVIERVIELHAELEGESVERIVGSVAVGVAVGAIDADE